MLNVINTIELDKKNKKLEISHLEKGVYQIISAGQTTHIEVLDVNIDAKQLIIRYQHTIYELEFENELDIVLSKMGIDKSSEVINTDIKAPMPGKVLDIVVKEGDQVAKGDAILILEAMKMENVLKAESDCSIKKVHVASSDNVEKNQLLIELDV